MANWFSYKFTDDEGHTVMVRGKEESQIEEKLESGDFKHRLQITINYEGKADDLLPTDEDLAALDVLEYELETEFNNGKSSVLALSFTGDNKRVWTVYTTNIKSAVFQINKAIEPEIELEIVHDTDENWHFYKDFFEKKL